MKLTEKPDLATSAAKVSQIERTSCLSLSPSDSAPKVRSQLILFRRSVLQRYAAHLADKEKSKRRGRLRDWRASEQTYASAKEEKPAPIPRETLKRKLNEFSLLIRDSKGSLSCKSLQVETPSADSSRWLTGPMPPICKNNANQKMFGQSKFGHASEMQLRTD